MELLIILLIFVIILIGVPISISYLIYRWVEKSEIDKKYRLLSIIPLIIVGYLIYDAVYPDSDFYKTDFEEVTEIKFPENGKIIYKTASFPDQFGDYTSSFLVEFDKAYIKKLEANLKNKNFIKQENKMSSNELNYIESRKGNLKYSAEYEKIIDGGKHYTIGFLNDNKSVIITRVSW